MPGIESHRYDGHGRRALTQRNDGSTVVSVYTVDGQLRYRADSRKGGANIPIYLGDDLVADVFRAWSTGAMTSTYQHTDALGSPVAVTNQAGAVIERTNYDPYGGAIGKVVDGIGYTGHVMDPATGLTYMQQRYYDQGVGRFLSVDPVTASSINGGNFNRYWYANNNPYLFTDPDGRLSLDELRPRRSCEVANACLGGSGGRSRAEASQDKAYKSAKSDESQRQPLIDRMHAAGGWEGPAPQYDSSLPDAGEVNAIDGTAKIGPSAFEFGSAADLGSVIFHEIVPHTEQFQALSDFQKATHDNRLNVLEFEAHKRTLSGENPFSSRISPSYRGMATEVMKNHLSKMNPTNRALVEAGMTCATSYCSGE